MITPEEQYQILIEESERKKKDFDIELIQYQKNHRRVVANQARILLETMEQESYCSSLY